MPTIYTVKMDSRYPRALVLQDGFTRADTYEGYYNARELHEYMQDQFGADAQRLTGAQFQAELEQRQVHTPETLALLKRDGDLLGQDLSKYFVYGSFNRPMDSMWARRENAVYIQVDKYQTGYHTYVAVPALLDVETVSHYELELVSRAPVDAPSECALIELRSIPIE